MPRDWTPEQRREVLAYMGGDLSPAEWSRIMGVSRARIVGDMRAMGNPWVGVLLSVINQAHGDGWNLRELYALAEVDEQRVKDWRAGDSRPDPIVVQRMAAIVGGRVEMVPVYRHGRTK